MSTGEDCSQSPGLNALNSTNGYAKLPLNSYVAKATANFLIILFIFLLGCIIYAKINWYLQYDNFFWEDRTIWQKFVSYVGKINIPVFK